MVGSAHAEMIPQTPAAQVLLQRGLADQSPQGEIIRQLHALPNKVNLTTKPGMLERLAGGTGDDLLGLFRPNMGTGYTLFINEPAHRDFDKDEIIKTLAHEAGHGVAQIAGVGGVRQPTGLGALDMLANAVAGPRLEVPANETLADSLAGLYKKTSDKTALVKQIMQRKMK